MGLKQNEDIQYLIKMIVFYISVALATGSTQRIRCVTGQQDTKREDMSSQI